MTFAEQFHEARKAASLTQAEAATRIGVSKRLIEMWEAGDAQPPLNAQAITQENALELLKSQIEPFIPV